MSNESVVHMTNEPLETGDIIKGRIRLTFVVSRARDYSECHICHAEIKRGEMQAIGARRFHICVSCANKFKDIERLHTKQE